MNLLQRCTLLWGSADLYDDDPHVRVVDNCVYLPYSHGNVWGLFSSDGKPVLEAIDFREGVHVPGDQRLPDEGRIDLAVTERSDTSYIYIGRINFHYGHFLINTLPRFWNITKIKSPNTKILFHGPMSVEQIFSTPYVKTIFSMLGLRPEDFVKFAVPTKIKHVVVPKTSFEEQRAGFYTYKSLCGDIGRRILHNKDLSTRIDTLYYSKTRLKSAVGIITNEAEIEEYMREKGAIIAYPEELSLEEQVLLMSSAEKIIASAGSFLHTSIFCSPRNISCLNVTEQINSNYTIIDMLNRNNAEYYYPIAMQVLPQQDGYLTTRYLPEARAVAEKLFEVSRS
ncbi:MAG: glycosyltransferase family 61 protein [Methylorubrum extorquens]|jgi:hypothetical protein|uniref:glycosyltransferase family 61 protein n=1 Tax=Methylorubrum extorquens TaxID=408 RepID=UPI002FEDE7FE